MVYENFYFYFNIIVLISYLNPQDVERLFEDYFN